MIWLGWIFRLSFAFLAYTFVGYPALVWLLAAVRGRNHERSPIRPTVSLIVAAYNAGAVIEKKVRNCLALTYPEERREIIVASDASQDETERIVTRFADRGVRLVAIPERRGKHYVQMRARDVSRGEVLVFTDASVELEPDALEKMVANFADPAVGCVSSEDAVVGKDGKAGEGHYIQVESWLRRLESRAGSLVGVSGSFFAARRELCDVWHPEQSSDFFVALHAVQRGLRAVVDPQCLGIYGLTRSERTELQRKVRTIVHGLEVFFTHLELLNPFRYPVFSWQLVSHKLFRWLAPFAFLALLLSNLFLWNQGTFYRVTFIFQAALYVLGLTALAARGLARFKLFKLPAFFLVGSAATVLAWFKFFSGEKFVTWEPTRR